MGDGRRNNKRKNINRNDDYQIQKHKEFYRNADINEKEKYHINNRVVNLKDRVKKYRNTRENKLSSDKDVYKNSFGNFRKYQDFSLNQKEIKYQGSKRKLNKKYAREISIDIDNEKKLKSIEYDKQENINNDLENRREDNLKKEEIRKQEENRRIEENKKSYYDRQLEEKLKKEYDLENSYQSNSFIPINRQIISAGIKNNKDKSFTKSMDFNSSIRTIERNIGTEKNFENNIDFNDRVINLKDRVKKYRNTKKLKNQSFGIKTKGQNFRKLDENKKILNQRKQGQNIRKSLKNDQYNIYDRDNRIQKFSDIDKSNENQSFRIKIKGQNFRKLDENKKILNQRKQGQNIRKSLKNDKYNIKDYKKEESNKVFFKDLSSGIDKINADDNIGVRSLSKSIYGINYLNKKRSIYSKSKGNSNESKTLKEKQKSFKGRIDKNKGLSKKLTFENKDKINKNKVIDDTKKAYLKDKKLKYNKKNLLKEGIIAGAYAIDRINKDENIAVESISKPIVDVHKTQKGRAFLNKIFKSKNKSKFYQKSAIKNKYRENRNNVLSKGIKNSKNPLLNVKNIVILICN